MTSEAGPEYESDPRWEHFLIEGHKPLLRWRSLMKHLPSDPRCRVCANPFGGMGGKLTGLVGMRPSRKNPNLCGNCVDTFQRGGALVDVGVLFADLRGSTALGETMGAAQFANLLNRFYRVATDTLLAHDAVIDKLIGDEVMALFLPGIAGANYRQRAIDAALMLVRAGQENASLKTFLPFGVAVHAGPAFVGNVGDEGIFDFTALGDTVNIAARLQSFAQAGELVISEDLCNSVTAPNLEGERRLVKLKGKSEPIAIRIVQA